MLHTSYFANHRKFPENYKKISVSRFTPKWFKADHNALELAPSAELLLKYKNNEINDEEYTLIYNEQLSKLNPEEIVKKYENSIFLCYEKDGDFCHRALIRNWLKNNGFEIEELK